MKSLFRNLGGVFRAYKRTILIVCVTATALLVVLQFVYPSGKFLPFTRIESTAVGGQQKAAVISSLDRQYADQKVQLFFGQRQTAQFSPTPRQLGITVSNAERVQAMTYPWYIRLIPGSVLWYGALSHAPAPTVKHDDAALQTYVQKELGDSCNIKPVSAGFKITDNKVAVTPAQNGGKCEPTDVLERLRKVQPGSSGTQTVRIPMTDIPPTYSTTAAQTYADSVNKLLTKPITVPVGDQSVTLDSAAVASWLQLAVTNDKPSLQIDVSKASDTLAKVIGPKVAVAAGTTRVTTQDFTEISRVNGPSGRAIDTAGTATSLAQYLSGAAQKITVATRVIAPQVTYTRTYSPTDTGLSALIQNYATSHPGTYGVQLIELSGKHRRAGYNETKSFITASTYKLFVAYGTLQKIESGEWHWTDSTSNGRNLSQCFDDMIVKSDNACAEAMLYRYGSNNLTNTMHQLGLNNTKFAADHPYSTPADEALFLGMLASNQLLTQQSSRDTLLGAMRRQVYRQGIPAGAPGPVADKVGFLYGLLHDAAIVYAPTGTYVLVIMTDNSSWSTIADLTRQIEALRVQ